MLVGQKIGPFFVDKELGSGAMGSVYRGKHIESGKKVAIKVIAVGLASNENALKRFQRETKILKQLDHPNIVKLIASGKVHGTPFYVMDYIEGESLDHVMDRRNRITWEELVTLGQQLCGALEHAHQKGIIHRDLKPSNLMILKDGTVKLTDFGIAKDIDVTALTAANATVGTASYMSPEQCRGSRDITNKSDLYSMGVMFYELVTGRKPFMAETVMEMFMQHTKGTFPRPARLVMDLPVWLDNLICQLLEKEPDKRPFSAEAVSESLGLVKQKWEQQQSAAMTAVKRRRADRSETDIPLDDTDKDLARTMLGKKKKVRKEPFYQKAWFTLTSVGAVLVALLGLIYFAFIKAPSAESLYAQADRLMKGDINEKHNVRRDATIDPIAQFLSYYPDHPKANQMRQWADRVDREIAEKQMMNRWRGAWKTDGEAEPVARQALDQELDGKLTDAARNWESLLKHKDSQDPEMRPWGLIAAKHLEDIKDVDDLLKELTAKYSLEVQTSQKSVSGSEAETTALEAVRLEQKKNWRAAEQAWGDLKKFAEQQPDERRRWLLLGARRLRELPTLMKGKDAAS